jgi:hypothetical protein
VALRSLLIDDDGPTRVNDFPSNQRVENWTAC